MSRVIGDAMVGNDIIQDVPRPTRKITYRADNLRGEYFAPNIPKQSPKSLTLFPNLFKQMIEATTAYSAEQNITADAYASPLLGQVSYNPERKTFKRKFHTSKSMIFLAVTTIIIASLTATGLIYKSQIMAAVNNAKMAISQKPISQKPNTKEIAIPSSNYNQALTALMTQQITINITNSSRVVSPSTIVNWLSIKEAGKLTYISVKTNRINSYINQLVNGVGAITAEQVSIATNKIADNLLKANGVIVNL